MVINAIKEKGRFSIYGAQVVAYGAYVAIREMTGCIPESFVVKSLNNNPASIDGIPVVELDGTDKSTFFVVAVSELIQKYVLPDLIAKGYKDFFIMSAHEEHLLMSKYFDSIGLFRHIDVEACGSRADMAIYEVKNHRDKPLEKAPRLYDFEYPIQAGAQITDERIAPFLDNDGDDNISGKNKMYCEMSATYWVWKNDKHRFVGIEHYRRHLMVKPEFLNEDIDAVLPLPYICYPDTMHQFRRFVSDNVYYLLLRSLREVHPDEYSEYEKILFGKYQYTYNMVCAKREVFDDYCKWFFEITKHMETYAEEVPEIIETRALSYVAEVLTNLYFMHNQNHLNIRHVEKEIYV